MKLKGSHTSHVCSQELFPILPAPEPLLSSDFLVPQPSGPSTRAALAGWDAHREWRAKGWGWNHRCPGNHRCMEKPRMSRSFRHAIVKKPDFYPGSWFDFTCIFGDHLQKDVGTIDNNVWCFGYSRNQNNFPVGPAVGSSGKKKPSDHSNRRNGMHGTSLAL